MDQPTVQPKAEAHAPRVAEARADARGCAEGAQTLRDAHVAQHCSGSRAARGRAYDTRARGGRLRGTGAPDAQEGVAHVFVGRAACGHSSAVDKLSDGIDEGHHLLFQALGRIQ
jgi:hypothetical protein